MVYFYLIGDRGKTRKKRGVNMKKKGGGWRGGGASHNVITLSAFVEF